MRIVCPCRSLSVARACARVDSGLDKAKISSDHRVDADRPRLRAVFGGGKTFLHSLGQTEKSGRSTGRSALPPPPDMALHRANRRFVPKVEVRRTIRSPRRRAPAR